MIDMFLVVDLHGGGRHVLDCRLFVFTQVARIIHVVFAIANNGLL